MLKLIKLEWIKGNVGRLIRYVVIMTAALLVFLIATAGERAGADAASAGIYERSIINAAVEVYTNMTYIVFTGVLMGSFIVAEFERGTISLMFSYPIKRQDILLSKIFSVWIFNVVALMISKIFIYVVLFTLKSFINISAQDIPFGALRFWLDMFLSSVVMISISYIALPIGLKMESSKTTVIATMLIAVFSHVSFGEYTLIGNIPFYIGLLLISAVSVFLTLFRLETKDMS